MELNTDLTISTSTTDYRGDIMISTQDLSIAANREVVQFKTDLTISAYSDGTLKSEMKTDLCFSNNTMLFSIIDYAEVRKSILYFSKFFNTNFEEAYLWDILAQGTSEQINKSHLADVYTAINNVAARLNNFLEGTDADDIINTWKELQDFLKGISGVQDLYTLIKSMVTLDNLLPILKDHFIRKDQDDTTAYNITFANTADEGGNGITLGDKFVPDSYGGRLNAYYDSNHTLQTKLEIDYLKVRKKATFTELTIEELKSVGGSIILSPAAMKCSLVETTTILQEDIDKITQSNMYYDSETQTYKPYCAVGDIVFRCYFTDEDEDGTKIYNQFVAGDQARCQTFNVSEIKDYTGTADTTGSRYYWRLVVNVGENYIDLSQNDKDDLSDVPVVGDNIVQFGHRHDPTRQAAQVLSAYGTTAPSHIMYQGVGSTMQFPSTVEGEPVVTSGPYSLYGKDVYGLYYNVDSSTPQNSKMMQYTYGDWYVGTRDQDYQHPDTTFLKFDTEKKQLTLRGIMIQSQYGDTQPIEFYRGVYTLDNPNCDEIEYYYMDSVTYTDENGLTSTYIHSGRNTTKGTRPTDTSVWTPKAVGTIGTPGEPAYAAYIDNPNDSIMVGSDSILSSGTTVTTYTGVSIPYGTESLNLTAADCAIPEELQKFVKLNSKTYVEADKEYRFAFAITGDGTTKLETNYKIVLTVTGTTPDGAKEISRSAVYTLIFINKGIDGETIQIVPSTTEIKYYTNATNPYFNPSSLTCKVMRKIGTQSYSECTLPNVSLQYTIDGDTKNVYSYTGQTLIPSSSDSDSTHFTDRVDFILYYDSIIIGSQPVTILSDGKNGDKGDKGDKGDPGSDGQGIEDTLIAYAISQSGSIVPSPESEWLDTIPELTQGYYLWTRTTIVYTDTSKANKVSYTIAYIGKDGVGKQGKAGCIYRVTRWETGKEYRNDQADDSAADDGLRYIDVVTDTDMAIIGTDTFNMYICQTKHTSATDNSDEPGVGANWENFWTKQSSYAPMATPFLLAKQISAHYIDADSLTVKYFKTATISPAGKTILINNGDSGYIQVYNGLKESVRISGETIDEISNLVTTTQRLSGSVSKTITADSSTVPVATRSFTIATSSSFTWEGVAIAIKDSEFTITLPVLNSSKQSIPDWDAVTTKITLQQKASTSTTWSDTKTWTTVTGVTNTMRGSSSYKVPVKISSSSYIPVVSPRSTVSFRFLLEITIARSSSCTISSAKTCTITYLLNSATISQAQFMNIGNNGFNVIFGVNDYASITGDSGIQLKSGSVGITIKDSEMKLTLNNTDYSVSPTTITDDDGNTITVLKLA
jgi:hypothetical protein